MYTLRQSQDLRVIIIIIYFVLSFVFIVTVSGVFKNLRFEQHKFRRLLFKKLTRYYILSNSLILLFK